jgi:hypothetical protein
MSDFMVHPALTVDLNKINCYDIITLRWNLIAVHDLKIEERSEYFKLHRLTNNNAYLVPKWLIQWLIKMMTRSDENIWFLASAVYRSTEWKGYSATQPVKENAKLDRRHCLKVYEHHCIPDDEMAWKLWESCPDLSCPTSSRSFSQID